MSSSAPITLEHARFRELATRLTQLHPDDAQILDLATALYQIGCGTDANKALGIKRRKGNDDTKQKAHFITQAAIRWIAGRMNLDGEKPPNKIDAIREAAKAFDLDVENLTRACPSIKELTRIATFDWDSQRPRVNNPRD